MNNNTLAWVRLNLIEGLSIARKLDLLRIFSDPEQLFLLSKDSLTSIGLKNEQADSIIKPEKNQEALNIIEKCKKKNIKIVTMADGEYPEMLRYINDPPMILFVKGKIPKGIGIGVVGSRKASGYGMEMSFKLASDLSREDIVVVSGMARGIDTAAHTGALNSKGQTIAVLGCGPDKAYPPENRSLMERISESGAVISEYPPGVEPATYHFPTRNRIISGISLGVLVVEAGIKSGSLITAHLALEQGREVFAVPGNINHYNSLGANKLIREGAKLVMDVQDILEEIPWRQSSIARKTEINSDRILNKSEEKILGVLKREDLYQDEICGKTGIPLQDLFSILLDMELKGIVNKDLTGKYRISANIYFG